MKKLTVWALLAMLVIAGSAFAAPKSVVGNATFDTGNPTTTDNDDTCDIGVAPAATLLLPYFEVSQSGAETTLFTITNTSAEEQIAHVTLWTDYSFPVIDFNIYLTGYDVQAINLHDVIWRGVIAPDLGTGTDVSDTGDFSVDNADLNLSNCDNLPGTLPQVYVTRMQSAFTLGRTPALGNIAGCNTVGSVHTNAVGYATIDVARLCSTSLPTDPAYFATEIMFDNVLVGDYQQVNSTQNFAQGNPMVHIRAIPEGGLPGDGTLTNFDRTFYSRYQAGGTADRRQPLPSVFAARWINGSTAAFQTSFKIWREGDTIFSGTQTCAQYPGNVTSITETVIFDEEENPEGAAPSDVISPPISTTFTLPETSLTSVSDRGVFPAPTAGAIAGWVYMNLDNDSADQIASQNWVVVSMRAEGRYSVDFDAAWLANGCTPAFGTSEVNNGPVVIGPAVADGVTNPNVNP
jgi:hypothetical protein